MWAWSSERFDKLSCDSRYDTLYSVRAVLLLFDIVPLISALCNISAWTKSLGLIGYLLFLVYPLPSPEIKIRPSLSRLILHLKLTSEISWLPRV